MRWCALVLAAGCADCPKGHYSGTIDDVDGAAVDFDADVDGGVAALSFPDDSAEILVSCDGSDFSSVSEWDAGLAQVWFTGRFSRAGGEGDYTLLVNGEPTDHAGSWSLERER